MPWRSRHYSSPADEALGWYITFIAIAITAFVGIDYLTGADAIAGTARFAWNAIVIAGTGLSRVAGGFLALVAKGIGWRRLSRLSTAILSVGLGLQRQRAAERQWREARERLDREAQTSAHADAATVAQSAAHRKAGYRRSADRKSAIPPLAVGPVSHRLPRARRAASMGAVG